MSARHFNPSAYSENQLSKFMITNGVLICDQKGKNTPIQPFFFQIHVPDQVLNFASI